MEGDIAPIEEKIYSETSQGGISGSAEIKRPGLLRFFTPRSALIAFGILAITIAGILLYRNIVLHEEISEFEFLAKESDAAGVAPTTSFLLTSSADLSTAVITRHLVFDPPIEYDIKKIASSPSVFEVIPEAALRADTIYSIRIDEGSIASHPYGWAYQVKAPFQVISTLPRDKGTDVPLNTGIEIVFNRENLEEYENAVEINPLVRGRFEVHRKTLIFIPTKPLLAQTLYTIRVKPGIRAEGSTDTVSEERTFRFETSAGYDQKSPYVRFEKTFWEFKPDLEPVFGAYANDSFTAAQIRVYRLGSAEEFMALYKESSNEENYWSYYHRFNSLSLPDEKRVFDGTVQIEKQGWNQFLRLPQKLEEGYYIADVAFGENRHAYAWFQMTQTAAFSAVSGTKTLVWFKDIATGENANEAEISFEGRPLGKTSSDGVFIFDTPPELVRERENSDYPYDSRGGGDYFFVAAARGKKIVVPAESDYGYFSKVSPPDAWWDYFSVDKTVYLPTDTVRFWGIVKKRNGGDVRGQEIKIKLTNSYWDGTPKDEITVYGEATANVGDFYTVTGAIPFSNLRPGLYQLSVRQGSEIIVSEHINIETYIKPAYRILLSPDKEAVFAGDSITYKVKAEFFDGTPVEKLRVRASGYHQDEITLDDRGEGSFTFQTEYNTDTYNYWPRYFGMSVRPAVAEEGEISAYASVLVFGPKMELGVEQIFSKDVTHFTIQLNHISLANVNVKEPYWYPSAYLGDFVPDWPVSADIFEVIHRKTQTGTGYDPINKITYPMYAYSTDNILIRKEILSTDARGKANLEFRPEKGKTYRIEFSARDSANRVTRENRYVYGGEYSYYGQYDPRGIVLKNSDQKEHYTIGDPITLELQDAGGKAVSPASGKFVFIRIANGIQSYQITDSPEYSDTFNESYVPNVQIMAVWFTGARFEDAYPINLSFNSESRRLSIAVLRDKERYRPGEKASLGVTVTDSAGRPQKAEVNVSGIDEAVFSLRPEEKDITNTLYQDVFSYVVTRSSHFTPLESGAEKGCFLEGTRVTTPEGEKRIEDIRQGDDVITKESDGSPVLVRARIKKVSSHFVAGYIVINNSLRLTINHRLFVNGGWKEAGAIVVGDVLMNSDGTGEAVRSIERVREWRPVYNIEIEAYHTFFANGIYVHNEEKGGGDARTDFRDVAIFESKETNGEGQTRFSIDLPDNLTSWRLTFQAVTKDLLAGKRIEFLPVGLPFFVDAALNRTYLSGDDFFLRLRTFGTAKNNETVSYAIESASLPFKKIERSGGDTIQIPLGKLQAGNHTIKISAKGGGHEDAIERSLSVLQSYFTKTSTEWYEISPNLSNIRGSEKGFTRLAIASYERGRFYPVLRNLLCRCGVRIDQRISPSFAKAYLNRFFGEKFDAEVPDAKKYQTPGGAMSLLPYSDDDLHISAKFAHLMQREDTDIDRELLKKYLHSSLNDRKADIHRIVVALYGLAAFREPVLVSLERVKDENGLDMTDRIYIALAFDALGAKEEARAYYRGFIKPRLVEKKPFMYLEESNDYDENLLGTTLLAGLAADLREPEADGLGNYAIRNRPKRTLHTIETLLYLKSVLPTLKEGSVSFSYRSSAKSDSKELKNAETFELLLSPEELRTLMFENVEGRVSLTSMFEEESSPAMIKKDSSIGVSRAYWIPEGRKTNEFEEGDLVLVEIIPKFEANALPGAYQITDYLPSGLRAVTNIVRRPYGEEYYPSDIEDQKITFVAWNPQHVKPIRYYARVVSKGTYKAEPALIESLESTETKNISDEATITIR